MVYKKVNHETQNFLGSTTEQSLDLVSGRVTYSLFSSNLRHFYAQVFTIN